MDHVAIGGASSSGVRDSLLDSQEIRASTSHVASGDGEDVVLLGSHHSHHQRRSGLLTFRLVFVVSITLLGSFLCGFNLGFTHGGCEELRDNNDKDMLPKVWQACLPLGAVFGSAIAGFVANRLGRRVIFFICAFVFFAGGLTQLFSKGIIVFIIGRSVTGIGVGLVDVGVPLYIAEVSPPKHRGALTSLHQLSITVGIFVAYILPVVLPGKGWMPYITGVTTFPAVILLIMAVFFLKDTPRWLVHVRKTDEARLFMSKLRGGKELIVDEELEDMELEECHDTQRQKSASQCLYGLSEANMLRPLILGAALHCFQQGDGINIIVFYSRDLFSDAGCTPHLAQYATTGIMATQVIATFMTVFMVDRLGRRPLLMASWLGMAVFTFALGGVLMMNFDDELCVYTITPCLVGFMCFFAWGAGTVPWLVITEIFPTRVRGSGMGVCLMANWASALVVTMTMSYLQHSVEWYGSFMVYGGCSLCLALFTYCVIPETKGRSLEAYIYGWISGSRNPGGSRGSVNPELSPYQYTNH